MTEREITSVALKLFAVYLLVQLLLAFPTVIASLASAKDVFGRHLSGLWLWGAAAMAIMIAIAAALVLWRLANKALAATSGGKERNSFLGIEWAVFSALGLFLLVQALIHFSYVSAGAYVQYVQVDSGDITLQTAVQMGAYIFEAIIGLSLILRTDGWVLMLRKLRNAGVPNPRRVD